MYIIILYSRIGTEHIAAALRVGRTDRGVDRTSRASVSNT